MPVERQIDNVSDSGKYDMRALFQGRCRNRNQITIIARRLREEFRNLISGNISEGRIIRWSQWRREVWICRKKIDE